MFTRELTPRTAINLIKADLTAIATSEKVAKTKNKSLAKINLLLKYQRQWIKAGFEQKVSVAEKSRRVGLSWCDAVISVLKASKAKGGNSTYYISYNREMTEQYVNDCAFWAKVFNIVGIKIKQRILHDEDKDILIYRIKFASGHRIVALSSKPKNLRSKKGDLVFDEFAFVEAPEELLKAGLALLVWGGNIRIISTHNGVDTCFNQLILDIKSGKKKYYHQKITFRDAISEGLYKRICLVNGEDWTLEKEFEWIKTIYEFYGFGADEELDCLPSEGKFAGQVFNKTWFKVIPELPCEPWIKVRAYDLAGTKNEPLEEHFYTVGCLLYLCGEKIVIADWLYGQWSISNGDKIIEETAINDGYDVSVILEQEGGDQGARYILNMQERLIGFDVQGIKPRGEKIIRALPIANEARRGNVYLLEAPWNQKFCDTIHKVSDKKTPLVTDLMDSLSLGYQALKLTINPLFGT